MQIFIIMNTIVRNVILFFNEKYVNCFFFSKIKVVNANLPYLQKGSK